MRFALRAYAECSIAPEISNVPLSCPIDPNQYHLLHKCNPALFEFVAKIREAMDATRHHRRSGLYALRQKRNDQFHFHRNCPSKHLHFSGKILYQKTADCNVTCELKNSCEMRPHACLFSNRE